MEICSSLRGLFEGNFTKDFPELNQEGGLWVSAEKCLDVFNKGPQTSLGRPTSDPDGGRRPKRQDGDDGDRH